MISFIWQQKSLKLRNIRGLRISLKLQGKIEDNDIFNVANISNLENRRKVHLRNFVFKNKSKCLVKDENLISTRENSGPRFEIIKPNRESFKRNVYYFGAVDCNNLDSDDRNLIIYQYFKLNRSHGC